MDEQVRLEVKQHGDRLATTMRRLAATVDRADCRHAPAITRLRDRMLAQSRALTPYRVEPAFREDIVAVHGSVRELDTDIDDLLRACREQRELERAADEIDQLADEIEAEANEP